MSKKDITQLTGHPRGGVSKGAVRQLRLKGLVPASIYGDKKEPMSIAVPEKELNTQRYQANFHTKLYEITIEGKKEVVLARNVQIHPVTDRPIHVDFLRVGENSKIRLSLPFVFTGQEKSIGLKFGGLLNIVHHSIEVYCQANAIPNAIEIDVSKMEVGDAIKLESVVFAKGVKPIGNDNITIATVLPPAQDEKVVKTEDGKSA